MAKYICTTCFLTFLLLIVGCEKKPTASVFMIGDGGIISNEPCGPPCFLGVEAGKTSGEEAFQILMEKVDSSDCVTLDQLPSIVNKNAGGWSCKQGFEYTFEKSTEVVNYIRFEPTQTVKIQDIIEKHGDPDFVGVSVFDGYEGSGVSVDIYFVNLRVVLPLGRYDRTEYEIKPKTLVSVVVYYDTKFLQNDIELKDYLIPWKGYGNYP